MLFLSPTTKQTMARKKTRRKRASPKTNMVKKLFAVVLFALFSFSAAGAGVYHFVLAAPEPPIVVQVDPNVGLEAQVRDFFTANGAEEMIDIISCESHFTHYNENGSILKNRHGSSAIGVAQIMSSVHPDPKIIYRYNKRHDTDLSVDDFDITTIEGNLGYALVLYKIRGTKDWECSKKFRFAQ